MASTTPDTRSVLDDHDAIYGDPIRVHRGERLRLTGRQDDWDGHRWVWAVAGGREGWVPDDLPDPTAAARYDYSAVELSVRRGERVAALRSSHGWCWCRAADGSEGWVPERVLSMPCT